MQTKQYLELGGKIMDSKHTPGPWSHRPGANDYGSVVAPCASMASGFVSVVSIHGRENEEEFEANLHLVMAAPELLEALRGLVSAIMENGSGADLLPVDPEWDRDNYEKITAARSAIAKATNGGKDHG